MNRIDGTITIAGTTYRLVLDAGALLALETVYSAPDKRASFEDVLCTLLPSGSVRCVRAVFWAMLRQHHPDVTIVRAGQLIDEAGGLATFIPLLTKSLN